MVEGFEGLVVEALLFEDFPEVFNGVEFWRVRWQGNQGDILGKFLGFRAVGSGSVEHQDNVFIGVPVAEFFEKNIQAFGSHIWQNQGDTGSVLWTGGGVGVGILSNDLFGNNRSVALRCPTASGLADSSKAGFILKEELKGLSDYINNRLSRFSQFF